MAMYGKRGKRGAAVSMGRYNRFKVFNPEERSILTVLLQEHANSVSEISVATGVRSSAYLKMIEDLENEAKGLS